MGIEFIIVTKSFSPEENVWQMDKCIQESFKDGWTDCDNSKNVFVFAVCVWNDKQVMRNCSNMRENKIRNYIMKRIK